jgi:hypothetical protein
MDIADPAVPPHIVMANRFFAAVFFSLLLFSIALAPWHGSWSLALLAGIPAALLPILFILSAPGALFTRMIVGAAVMIFCGLNIDQSHGMTELHFGVFVLLASGGQLSSRYTTSCSIICRQPTIPSGYSTGRISGWSSCTRPMWSSNLSRCAISPRC